MCHQDLVILTKMCSLLMGCAPGDIDFVEETVFSFPAQLHCSQFLVKLSTHGNVHVNLNEGGTSIINQSTAIALINQSKCVFIKLKISSE